MTWLGDPNAKPEGDARKKLLEERERIVFQIELLGISPLPNKTKSAALGRQEDLLNLAKKVKSIDKKLGRMVD
jgi:hypothetical protein